MRYWQPYGISDANAGYTNGNPTLGELASIPPAGAIEDPQREIVAAIAGTGQTASASDKGQLLKAIQYAWKRVGDVTEMLIDSTVHIRINTAHFLFGTGGAIIAADTGDTVDGAQLGASGFLNLSRNSNQCLTLRRRGGNGILAAFHRDGSSTVGSISATDTTTSFTTTSDERLKDFIGEADVDHARSIVLSHPVMEWTWNHVPGAPAAMGWGAQTLATVVPEAVAIGDDNPAARPGDPGFVGWGVDQSKLVPVLWAALAGEMSRTAALEARLDALEAELGGPPPDP